jgi:hypothetical protein
LENNWLIDNSLTLAESIEERQSRPRNDDVTETATAQRGKSNNLPTTLHLTLFAQQGDQIFAHIIAMRQNSFSCKKQKSDQTSQQDEQKDRIPTVFKTCLLNLACSTLFPSIDWANVFAV